MTSDHSQCPLKLLRGITGCIHDLPIPLPNAPGWFVSRDDLIPPVLLESEVNHWIYITSSSTSWPFLPGAGTSSAPSHNSGWHRKNHYSFSWLRRALGALAGMGLFRCKTHKTFFWRWLASALWFMWWLIIHVFIRLEVEVYLIQFWIWSFPIVPSATIPIDQPDEVIQIDWWNPP